ncbi:MAG TPA: GLPGLI family protein [Puia sp.]|uniref:GLPGLI family protein n=1 Tax=Puia sp. TaxID=2045100 RepID=UPI002C8540EE|nr:GLPGLI family protein [Puia sp.]HVU96157.1 GLPGLI family protein [Puia sp.]
MKKQLLMAVTALVVFSGAEAQKPDTAWLMVHYKFSHVRDTSNRANPYTENMVLFVGKSASAYRSYDGLVADQQFKKAWAEAVANSPDGNVRINRRGVGSPTRYYEYPGEQKLYIKENLMGDYLIEGPMPSIDWTISGDTAIFGGLHCQKAMGHFFGRDYIAWFCPDLPAHTGPWKLNGLPGVIVDARDTKNEVVFAFDGVEKTVPSLPKDQAAANKTEDKDLPPIVRGLNDDPNVIMPPTSLVTKTTQKEFDKLRATFQRDPAAFAQAMNEANSHNDGPKMDHIVVGPKGGRPAGPPLNNPIELPEK